MRQLMDQGAWAAHLRKAFVFPGAAALDRAEAWALNCAIYSAATDGERGTSTPMELEMIWDSSNGTPVRVYLAPPYPMPRQGR